MSETFSSFIQRVEGFEKLSPIDKICHAAWFLHSVKNIEFVSTAKINSLFNEIHETPPHTSVYLKRMAERKPKIMIKTGQGYRLERAPRKALQDKYGRDFNLIAISTLLSDLLPKLRSENEARFLDETLRCYSVRAFRATIVMAWNLTYDHLLRWILADAVRVDAFNASLNVKYPKKNMTVKTSEDFPEIKEFEVVETCQHAKLINKNVAEIMKEKLKRRNAAAHPSSIIITQAQVDDIITDLVNNVVLRLELQ